MRTDEILRLRLANQHLAYSSLTDPSRLVAHLGAVQAQDSPAAKWALGQRLSNAAAEPDIDRALADGAILRTHVLRPTWHFVVAADIRWMLALTGPRVKLAFAYNDRTLGIDGALLARSHAAIARALEGGHHLTRPEFELALRQAGVIASSGQMLGHLVAHAELDAIICSGPSRGKQLTYALLDERAPSAGGRFDRDEALAELTARYFTSHGPATLRDFAWWSGLTVTDARHGLALNGASFVHAQVDGVSYWFAPAAPPPMPDSAQLLPNYDEYTVAYQNRDLFYDPARALGSAGGRQEIPFGNVIVLNGRVAGTWKRTPRSDVVTIEPHWFNPPSDAHRQALTTAIDRYATFLNRRVELSPGSS